MSHSYISLRDPSLTPFVDHVGQNLVTVRITEQDDDSTLLIHFPGIVEARAFADCLLRQVALAEHLLMTVGGK